MNFKVTEIGELPLEWDVDTMENALDEIIDYRGKTPAKSEAGIETLSAKSVKNGYIDYSKAYFISEMTYQKFMVRGFPRKGDILLTTEAPLGLVAKLDREKVGIAQRLLTLRGKKDYLLNDYLLYYLMSNEGQHQLTSRQSGTTVTGIKQKEFRKCLISIPPFEEQKAIAHILSTLDDKIEVNNEINKTLENMAQAIFKQWFVDFEFPNEDGEPYKSSGGEMVETELGMIPKGWEVGTIGNYVKVKSGYAFKSAWWDSKGIAVIKIKDINNGTLNLTDCSFVSEKNASSAQEFIINGGEILIAMTGATIGKFAIVPKMNHHALVNQRVGKFFLGENPFDKVSFLYCILNQSSVYEEIVSRGDGSAQPNISPSGIESIKIVIPNSFILDKFNRLMKFNFQKITENIYENNKLVDLRDTLLPKLMSGEIRVPLDEEGEAS